MPYALCALRSAITSLPYAFGLYLNNPGLLNFLLRQIEDVAQHLCRPYRLARFRF
jgi:hypothetical protein